MGYSFVLDKVKTPSRFVMEIPAELMEDVGAKPRNRFSDDTDLYRQGNFSSEKPYASANAQRSPMSSLFEGSSNAGKKRQKKGKLRKGDLVHHASFGDGVIIRLEDGLATIAFEQKFGVRKIMADHPSLTKK